MSESNGNGKAEFLKALIKAKAKFKPLVKNKVNPHFKSEYADLAQLHDAVDDALAENGFTIMAPIAEDDKGQYVKTRLLHLGGHEEASIFRLPASLKPQEVGSALTYGARYSLQNLLGIAPQDEDDDGHAATNPEKKTYVIKKTEAPKPAPEPLVVPDKGPDPSDDRSWEVATILKVAMKEGKKGNGQTWQRFGVLLALQDGEETWVNTFDRDYGATASSLQGGKLARVALAPGKPFNGKETTDLVGIEPMPEEGGDGE